MKLLQLSIRSLSRYRLYSVINILGLAFSLACTIIVSRYVYSELSTDHFNSKLDRLYLVTREYEGGVPGIRIVGSKEMSGYAPYEKVTGSMMIEQETTFTLAEARVLYEAKEYEAQMLTVDTLFLQLLDYPLVVGNRNALFRDPGGVAVTRSFAKHLFGDANPMGQTITLCEGVEVRVDAIIGEPPTKSSQSFDMMVSRDLPVEKGIEETLFLFYPGVDVHALNAEWKDDTYEADVMGTSTPVKFRFFPLEKLYFDTTILKLGRFAQGNYSHVMVLSAAAVLILLAGLFNYISIYTLILQRRNREFGLKKVFGSGVHHVVGQLFVENLLLIGIALFIAWIAVELAGGMLQAYFGLTQVVSVSFDCFLSLGILCLLPLVVSVYPLMKYIYSPSITSLRSSLLGGKPGVARPVFLTVQYVVTITLIIVSLFFVKQLHYMLHADPGFRTDGIVKAQFLTRDMYKYATDDKEAQKEDERRRLEQISKKMDESPLFSGWQYSNSPNNFGRITGKFKTGEGEFIQALYANVTNDYLRFYDFRLVGGRFWDESDGSALPVPVIVNEAAMKIFGITDTREEFLYPENLFRLVGDGMVRNPSLQIVGVLKDFQTDHLSREISPMIFINDKRGFMHYATLVAAIVPGKRTEAIRFLQELHQETVGGDFSYVFVGDEIASLYKEDRKIVRVYSIFSLIAILISCMGLFGLSLFDMQQRYKEIAIRKVNGATTPVIVRFLLHKYYKLLLIAFLIAIPVSWLFILRYLENFAHKATVSWWLFAIALLLTAGISLLTLVWQVRKAAESNPAEAIKTE